MMSLIFFKSLQILVCLKLAPLGNTLIFGPIPFAPPTLSLTLLLKASEFLSSICLRILLFPIDFRPSSLKILFTRPFQSLLSVVVFRKFFFLPSFSILCTWCSSPVGNAGSFKLIHLEAVCSVRRYSDCV